MKNLTNGKLNFLFPSKRIGFYAFAFYIFYFVCTKNSFATHSGGCEITYEATDTFKYDVTVKFYRNCDGINAGLFDLLLYCKANYSSKESISLGNPTSVEFITKSCADFPLNCSNAGSNTGTQVLTYKTTVDLNTSKLSFLKTCGTVVLGIYSCCRGIATAHTSGDVLFNYSEIDLTETSINSSPKFSQNVQNKLCCNKPFYYNTGAIDTIDHDSLSYQWGPVLFNHNYNASFSSPLSYNHPVTVFYPTGVRPPTALPNGLQNNGIPIGLYLDAKNGDIIFTPTSCGEESTGVIEVLEWRKIPTILSNGDTIYQMKNIGKIRRDQRFSVINCPENNPPVIQADFNHIICENTQLCFDITAIDDPVIDPTNGTSSKLDTVRLSWNKAISGVSFEIINDSGRIDTAQFCWTPKIGQARSLPYYFVVEAYDDACRLSSTSTRSISITVEPFVETKTAVESLGCGQFSLQSSAVDTNALLKSNQWYVLDSIGNEINSRKVLHFGSNYQSKSNRANDTLYFKQNGTYIVVNSTNYCKASYDTITVSDAKNVSIFPLEKTLLCESDTLQLNPTIQNFDAPIRYQWGTAPISASGQVLMQDAQPFSGDTFSVFSMVTSFPQNDTAIYVKVTDSQGCTLKDRVIVSTLGKPRIAIDNPPIACFKDSVHLNPDISFINETRNPGVKWFFNNTLLSGENNFSLSVLKQGVYKISITDIYGCTNEKSIQVIKNDEIKVNIGDDREICFRDEIVLRARDIDTNYSDKVFEFQWIDILNGNELVSTNAEYKYTATTFKRWRFNISVTQNDSTCSATKDIRVAIKPLPQIYLPDNKELITQCFGYELPTLENGNYFSKIGGQGDEYFAGDTIVESKTLYVFARQNGCEANKSFNIVIHQLPKLDVFDNVIGCESYTLPNLSVGQYFEEPNRQGKQFFGGNIIQENATIYVSAENDCGVSEENFEVEIFPYPNVSFSKIENQLEATEPDAAYQWLDCEQDTAPISGAIFQTFTPSKSGIYALQVTKDGCAATSPCFNFAHSNISQLDVSELDVYPNPFRNSFTVDFGDYQNMSMTIYDIHGKIIYQENNINTSQKEIKINAAAGVYTLELRNDYVTKNIKIVKQ